MEYLVELRNLWEENRGPQKRDNSKTSGKE